MFGQCIFGWFEGMVQTTVVKSVNPFEPVKVDGRNGKPRDGRKRHVAYQNWLKFYTPLCDRGATL